MDYFENLYRHTFRNDSGEQIPAFGVIKLIEVATVTDYGSVLLADKPDTRGSQFLHYVNGLQPVDDTKLGFCAVPTQPVYAKYDTAATPANGEMWGPNSSFDLKKDVGGFQVIGGVTNGRVLVVQAGIIGTQIIRFETITVNCAAKTALVQIKSRPCGIPKVAQEDSYERLTVQDPMGCLLDEGGDALEDVEGFAAWMEDDLTGVCRWEVYQLCCTPNVC